VPLFGLSWSTPKICGNHLYRRTFVIPPKDRSLRRKRKKRKIKKYTLTVEERLQLEEEKEIHRRLYPKFKSKKDFNQPAKRMRILSTCNFWFSKAHLMTNKVLRDTIKRYHGYVPIKVLLTVPAFRSWATAQLMVEAFYLPVLGDAYEVRFDQELWSVTWSKDAPKSDTVPFTIGDNNELTEDYAVPSTFSFDDDDNDNSDERTNNDDIMKDHTENKDRSEDEGSSDDDDDEEEWDTSDDDDYRDEYTDEESEVMDETPINDDIFDYENAFVRHVRVDLEFIAALEQEIASRGRSSKL
jgi:hypothetical protein